MVSVAVNNDPTALKFALGGLNQKDTFLKKVGLWDYSYVSCMRRFVLSTRFSLDEKLSTTATIFALLMKCHPFLEDLNVYSPNCWAKDTCDPSWTSWDHHCNGTYATCKKPHHLKMGIPQQKLCWRYSFQTINSNLTLNWIIPLPSSYTQLRYFTLCCLLLH